LEVKMGTGEGKTASDAFINVIGQINPLIVLAAGIINSVRKIRDAAAAANPADADNMPTDAELIERLLTESGLLKLEANELREFLKTLLPKE